MDTLALAFPVGAFLFLLILFLFEAFGNSPSFTGILWVAVPLVAYLTAGLVLMGAQTSVCGSIKAGPAFLGALPTAAATLIALAIESVTFCRIPVVSLVAPLFISSTPRKNGQPPAPLIIETVENQFPMIKGMANGFYVFFATMFGMVAGSGDALRCH
jgi:hypothetical protein